MKLLHMDCSPRLESYSRLLSAAIVDRLKAHYPEVTIIRRDLGLQPIAHAQSDYAAVLSAPGTLPSDKVSEATQLSEQLIGEVEQADALVIGTPMHNFTLPSVFKAWIDQVLHLGRTMDITSEGEKVGLLQDKPVYIAISSGSFFGDAPGQQPDFLRPYLRAALGCIGLTSLQFISLQGTVLRSQDELAQESQALVAALQLPVG